MTETLYDIVASVCDLPLIWAYQNGKRPDAPFVLIDVRTTSAQWGDIPSNLDDDGKRTLSANREANVYLTCFGDGCVQALDRIAMLLRTDAVAVQLEAANTDIVDFESIQFAPRLFEHDYEPQAVLSFRYRYTATVTEVIDIIETVELSINHTMRP